MNPKKIQSEPPRREAKAGEPAAASRPASDTHLSRPPASLSPTAAAKGTPPGEGQDVMLTKEELAAKLRVAVRTIENWQHCGYLPFIKVANVVMFYWPAVLAHLQTHFAGTPGGGHQGGQKAEILKAEN